MFNWHVCFTESDERGGEKKLPSTPLLRNTIIVKFITPEKEMKVIIQTKKKVFTAVQKKKI